MSKRYWFRSSRKENYFEQPRPTDSELKTTCLPEKHEYRRPCFLNLSSTTEVGNHDSRTIFVSNSNLPFEAGYAECINGGKSKQNEDQASVCSFQLCIGDNCNNSDQVQSILVTYYGVFDGHGGTGVALMAANVLILHIQEKLLDIKHDIFRILKGETDETFFHDVTVDELVSGALETAFCSLDEQIKQEMTTYSVSGGCTALVVLALLGKLFVASTGDCRAVLCQGDEVKQLNKEATPWNERDRLQLMTNMCPELLPKEFTNTIFVRRVLSKDIGKKVLCKEATKSYWSYKVITEEDLLIPFIYGKGKVCRLMERIGVSRSIGDHNLTTSFSTKYKLKPFLIPNPEVEVFDLRKTSAATDDFIIMGCDGLWDVLSNKKACDIARRTINTPSDENRYIAAAEKLVHQARGNNAGTGWKLQDGHQASFDDICVFVIPLEPIIQNNPLKPLKPAEPLTCSKDLQTHM